MGLANHALYLHEIAKKYPHVVKSGKPFKIKIKTEDSTGCLQDKILLVDPSQTLQQGGIVKTLTGKDSNQTKREDPIENMNAFEDPYESAQSDGLEETKVSDIKEEFEEMEDDDLPVIHQQNENIIAIKHEESVQTKKTKSKKAPSGHDFSRKCSYCEKVFNKASFYRFHMRSHHYWG